MAFFFWQLITAKANARLRLYVENVPWSMWSHFLFFKYLVFLKLYPRFSV